MAVIISCDIIFWFWFSEKILIRLKKYQEDKRFLRKKIPKKILSKFTRLIDKKHNSYKEHKNKEIPQKLKTWGPIGLYFWALIPSLTFFLVGLAIQKLFIKARLGYWCLWLGVMTRIALSVFGLFSLIETIS